MPEEYEVNSLNKQLTPKRYLKKIGAAFVGGDFTGNARGANALDIQSSRSAVTQVASGANSSAVGYDNTASGERSLAIGSFANSSIYGEIALNNSNTATSEQISKFVLRKTTTNATQTTLSLSEGTQNLVLPSDTHLGFTCKVMGVSSAGVTNMYTFRGFIKNVGDTTTLSTTVVKEEFEEDTDWNATIEANDTTDSMDIKVTGEVATTIKWAATLDCVKIDNS